MNLVQAEKDGGPRSGSEKNSLFGGVALCAHSTSGWEHVFGVIDENARTAMEEASRKHKRQ
jgi:hypothetical protein